jgi:hypothetical protein
MFSFLIEFPENSSEEPKISVTDIPLYIKKKLYYDQFSFIPHILIACLLGPQYENAQMNTIISTLMNK